MINAAIVGLGRWGQNLVNAVQGKSPHLHFARGVVRNPDKVADFAAQHELRMSAGLAEALADEDIRAVVLATPNSLHPQQIAAAAAAGKAVFCEKPLALTRADAIGAVEACREAGVVLAVGQDKRWWPSMRELKDVVDSGALGDVLHVEGHFSNENATQGLHQGWRESPAEAPAASMTGTGIHVLDAFVNMLGPLVRVQAQHLTRRPPPATRDTLAILCEFPGNVSGVLCGVRATPLYWRVHVFGTAGSAEARGPNDLVLYASGKAPEQRSFEPVSALRAELEAFANAIDGYAPYPVTPEQMIDVIAALEAIAQSIRSQAPVAVAGSAQEAAHG
jgi:predicted dehydrogenase